MEEVRGRNMGEVRGSRRGRKGSGRVRVKAKRVWGESLEAEGDTQWSDVEPITTQTLQREGQPCCFGFIMKSFQFLTPSHWLTGAKCQ